MLRSSNVHHLPGTSSRSPKNTSYMRRLTPEQISTLDAEFNKFKTLHSTDLALLAAEMAVREEDVQAWYTERLASWRRSQGLSDCFGQV